MSVEVSTRHRQVPVPSSSSSSSISCCGSSANKASVCFCRCSKRRRTTLMIRIDMRHQSRGECARPGVDAISRPPCIIYRLSPHAWRCVIPRTAQRHSIYRDTAIETAILRRWSVEVRADREKEKVALGTVDSALSRG